MSPEQFMCMMAVVLVAPHVDKQSAYSFAVGLLITAVLGACGVFA